MPLARGQCLLAVLPTAGCAEARQKSACSLTIIQLPIAEMSVSIDGKAVLVGETYEKYVKGIDGGVVYR